MKKLLNKLMIPLLVCAAINMIGLWFHKDYDGAVAGSIVGMIIGFLILEIRAKFD